MTQSDTELTVAQRLGQLLDRGLLPAGGPAEAAERLIERLERPARVALLGLPGSGKSAILNLLTGAIVVPETLRLPTIIVQHGAEPRMICTLTDGRTEIVPGTDLNDVLSLNPALVTLEMDLPALKVISLLEVSAGAMEAEQRRAAIWASKRADILIWCTTSYLPKEQQVWEGMPDVVKDNGFLFLTKVDLLGSREASAGMLERVEMRAGEEFRQVLAISAKQARAAMPSGEPVDREMFRESGAAAIITTIKSRVQAARRADTDMAELLLARHVEAGGIVARRFSDSDGNIAPPTAPAQPWAPPPEASAIERDVVEDRKPVVEANPEVAENADLVQEPESEPEFDPEPEVEAEEAVAEPASEEPDLIAEPEPVPTAGFEPEPEPEPAPTRRPAFGRPSAREPDAQPEEGRKRFSDRIKQMPVPEDVPAMPLRSTWKSKAEATALRTAPPEPETPTAESPKSERRLEPRARPVAPKDVEPQDDDETLARMLASVVEPEPEAVGDEIEAEPEPELEDEYVAQAGAEDEESVSVEIESTRWAERLRPTETDAPAERSPRTSLFGSRKTAATPGQAPGAGPADRVARPTEPVTRVRAPAPRPTEPLRPATPSPEELATPRIIPTREPPNVGQDAATSERPERRRIITTRATPLAAPLTAEASQSVPTAEKELLDSAIRQIVSRSADLAATLDPDEKIPVDMILDHSRDTIEQVIALLGPSRSTGLRRIAGDLGEIQDIIMLMQLEKGHAPADDALTLLLQIRRDLETLRSA